MSVTEFFYYNTKGKIENVIKLILNKLKHIQCVNVRNIYSQFIYNTKSHYIMIVKMHSHNLTGCINRFKTPILNIHMVYQ